MAASIYNFDLLYESANGKCVWNLPSYKNKSTAKQEMLFVNKRCRSRWSINDLKSTAKEFDSFLLVFFFVQKLLYQNMP